MRDVKNETTGKIEKQFGGKLISVSEKTFQNSNNKEYRVATIEFEDAKGKTQRCSAMIYAKNYDHGVSVGEQYLCTATPMEGSNPIVQMSHLTWTGVRATATMFGFEEATVADPVTAPNAAFETEV